MNGDVQVEEEEKRHISFNLDDRQDEEEDLLGGQKSFGIYMESLDDQKSSEVIVPAS